MNVNETLTALQAAGLTRVASDLPALMRNSIRLTSAPTNESALAIGASKLGGEPDLPPGTAWPIGKGAPLAFIAQIRLADAHPYDTDGVLPASGLLSFFYDAQQQTFGADPADRGGWAVLFFDGDSALYSRQAPPAGLPQAARYTACALTCSSEVTLAQDPTLEIANASWTPDEIKSYETFLATFPPQADRSLPRHRLLGNPDTIQDDMRLECALAANGVTDLNDPRAAALKPHAMHWRLLLQIDSDDKAAMQWADAGMIYYWIEQDALAARQFDKTWLVLQSD